MTVETDTSTTADAGKPRQASGISAGILLISLGVLIYTGEWWPGIMIALGLAFGAELVFRGQIARAIGTLVVFWGIALVAVVVKAVDVPWGIIAPLILIGLGIIVLVKAFYLRDG